MKLAAILFAIVLTLPLFGAAYAHIDGCHSRHSCPSDTGSYTCGDKGYCSECPDNNHCKAQKPLPKIQISTVKAIPKKQTAETPQCMGKTLCITGKVTSVIDGDTLKIDTYKVRLSLVNTPETGQSGYVQAKSFTERLCPVGSAATVDQDDRQPFDRFKRLVGKIYCSEKLLNYELLSKNHAVISQKYCKTSEFSSEYWATRYGC